MGSVSKQQYPHALFFCPLALFENEEDEFRSIQFGESPILSPSTSSHIRPLDWCNNKEGKYNNFSCRVCKNSLAGTSFYFCKDCFHKHSNVMGYHKQCIEPISKHTYHPKHSLRLKNSFFSVVSITPCLCCSQYSVWIYSCLICLFIMCQDCARKPPILAINQPKRHEHTLFYFPRIGSLICDVCALSHHRSLMYSCTQCDFVTHKACVYFPCIIRISRHEHRLSFNSSLTPEKRLCGVCRGKIDTKYGRYSCVKGCIYSVHSECATRKDLWDGKELEGTPEDAHENIKSFIEISDGVIQHLNHRMRLEEETNRAFDENKRCHACTLPICDDTIYKCMHCDYVLHKTCAHLPQKIYHPVHPHPLSLQVDHQDDLSKCGACDRLCNCFMYLCKDCKYFRLDVNCAAISEPLDHPSHPHPLFLTFEPSRSQTCSICQRLVYVRLNCGECPFVLCFGCATLPNKLKYKHDEHFLICCYDKDASDQYWCDVCEEEADPKKNRVYMCKECNVTLHTECLLGEKYVYMMPGKVFNLNGRNVTTHLNNCLTRDICRVCTSRCKNKVVYNISDREILCSYKCVYGYLYYSYN